MPAESTPNLEWLFLQIHSAWSKEGLERVCEWISANPSPLLEKPLWNPKHGSVASACVEEQDKCVSESLIFDMIYFGGTEEELKYKKNVSYIGNQILGAFMEHKHLRSLSYNIVSMLLFR